ncbi:hypothetical protein SK128_023178, partial [Halocaridina rubra]
MSVPTSQVNPIGSTSSAVHPVNSLGHHSSADSKESLYPTKAKSKSKGKSKGKNSPHNGKGHIKDIPIYDTAQLDAGKQALKELLREQKGKKKQKTSCWALMKLYTTILAGLMIIGGLFTLLFLVPMTIDPALATLTYEFHPKPVLCMTTFADWIAGQTSIEWCSCTEGCTSDIYNCSQIVVVYKKCLTREISPANNDFLTNGGGGGDGSFGGDGGSCSLGNNSTGPTNNDVNTATYIDPEYWDVVNASLYINVKGCGYPPEVNCTTFFDEFGVPGRRFWCYYSKMDKYLVMPEYDPQAAELELAMSLGWTLGAQALGIIIIVVLHCPYVAFLKNLFKRRAVLQP